MFGGWVVSPSSPRPTRPCTHTWPPG